MVEGDAQISGLKPVEREKIERSANGEDTEIRAKERISDDELEELRI